MWNWHITFDFPQNPTIMIPWYLLEIGFRINTVFNPQFTESWMQNLGIWRDGCLRIEKNSHVSRSKQLESMLFKSQLYSYPFKTVFSSISLELRGKKSVLCEYALSNHQLLNLFDYGNFLSHINISKRWH